MDLHMTLPAGPGRRRAIYEQLRNAVLEARLRPGELLPPAAIWRGGWECPAPPWCRCTSSWLASGLLNR